MLQSREPVVHFYSLKGQVQYSLRGITYKVDYKTTCALTKLRKRLQRNPDAMGVTGEFTIRLKDAESWARSIR